MEYHFVAQGQDHRHWFWILIMEEMLVKCENELYIKLLYIEICAFMLK